MALVVAAALLGLVHSVSPISNLPSIVTSEDEVFSFPLFSYFSGNNLLFNITSTSTNGLDINLPDPFSMKQTDTFKYASANTYSGLTPSSTLLNVASVMGTSYVLNPLNNDIQLYSVDFQGTVTALWTYTVKTTYTQPVITRIRHYSGAQDNVNLLVLMESLETIKDQEFKRFDTYIVPIMDITEVPTSQTDLDIENFRYFSKVDLVPIMTPSGNTLLIVSCADISSGVETDFLMGYNITDITDVAFLQQIDSYMNIPGATGHVPLHTVGIAYINDLFYVLDREVGLVTFVIMEDFFLESDFIDIIRFGTPTSINAPVGVGNYLAVGTDKGLLVLDFTQADNEYKWIPIVLADGSPWIPYSAVLSGHYIFTNALQKGQNSFIIADYESNYISSIKRLWNLETEIGSDPFYPFAMYTVVQLLEPNQYVYFRSDQDALRVFLVDVGRWVLQGTASEATPYLADIEAIDLGDPLDVANSTLKVEYMTQKNTTILYGNGYLLGGEVVGPVIAPNIMGTDGLFEISVNELFSGPDMNYRVNFASIPAGVTLKYNPELPRTTLSESILLTEMSTNSVLLSATDDSLYISDGSTLHKCDLSGAITNTTTLPNDAIAISVVDSAQGSVYVLAENEQAKDLFTVDSYSFEVSATAKNVPNDCFDIKQGMVYLYCLSPSQLTLYSADMTVAYTITPAVLSLKELQITDITDQISVYSQRFILFIACKINGLVVVDVTNVMYAPVSLPASVQASYATDAAYLHSPDTNTLVMVNADGSIFTFDIENSPTTAIMKRIPGWEQGEMKGMERLSGLVVTSYEGVLYLYDYVNTVHNALFAVENIPGKYQIKGHSNTLYLLNSTATALSLSLLTPLGQSTAQGYQLTYPVALTLDPNEFVQDSGVIQGTVTAFNSFESQLVVPFAVNVESQGHVIFLNSTALPTTELIIPYNITSNLPLFTVFSGQNLDLYININGKYPYILYNETNYDPAVLWPEVELTDEYLFTSDVTDNTTSSIVLLPTNLTLALTGTALGVYEITGVPHGEWTHVPNATLKSTSDLADVTHNLDIQDCPLISLVSSSLSTALLAVYCYGNQDMLVLGSVSGASTFNQLSFLELNLQTLNVTEVHSELLPFSPVLFRARNATQPQEFYFAMVDYLDTNENNHLVWSKLMWQPGNVKYTYNQTVVDFYLLGLDTLCIADVDILPNEVGAILYVADECYGLRVVQFTPTATVPVQLMTSLSLPVIQDSYVPGDAIQSVCLCNGLLYAIETSTILLRFSLKSLVLPDPLPPYQRYNTAASQYTTTVPSLTCSSMDTNGGGFLAARLSDGQGNAVARIYDLEADADSAILRDVKLGTAPEHYTQVFSFYGGLLSTLEDDASAFQVWLIRHAYIEFPLFTDEAYQHMTTQWGTPNFTILVTAINEQMELNTTSIFVSRSTAQPSPPSKSNDDSSPSYWWVWLLIAILVVLLFIGSFLAIRVYRKRRNSTRSISLAEEPLPVNEFRED